MRRPLVLYGLSIRSPRCPYGARVVLLLFVLASGARAGTEEEPCAMEGLVPEELRASSARKLPARLRAAERSVAKLNAFVAEHHRLPRAGIPAESKLYTRLYYWLLDGNPALLDLSPEGQEHLRASRAFRRNLERFRDLWWTGARPRNARVREQMEVWRALCATFPARPAEAGKE